MPTISRFSGILLRMYYDEQKHRIPHVHANVGGKEASFKIRTAEMFEGSIPAAKADLVRAWIRFHQSELLNNWDRAKLREPLLPIAPLKK